LNVGSEAAVVGFDGAEVGDKDPADLTLKECKKAVSGKIKPKIKPKAKAKKKKKVVKK
jgi:DNA topoisomerase-1